MHALMAAHQVIFITIHNISDYQRRIDQIVEWLSLPEAQRPRFIASYFSIG